RSGKRSAPQSNILLPSPLAAWRFSLSLSCARQPDARQGPLPSTRCRQRALASTRCEQRALAWTRAKCERLVCHARVARLRGAALRDLDVRSAWRGTRGLGTEERDDARDLPVTDEAVLEGRL